MTSVLDDYDLYFIMQTPIYEISEIFVHKDTTRIPIFKRWKHITNANNLDEVKQELAPYLNPEGKYRLVSEKGTFFSTKLTFVEKGREPQKPPGKIRNILHVKVTPGFSRGSLLEEIAEVQ